MAIADDRIMRWPSCLSTYLPADRLTLCLCTLRVSSKARQIYFRHIGKASMLVNSC